MTTIAMTAAERRRVLEDPNLTDVDREQIFAAAAAGGGAGPAAPEATQTFSSDEAASLAIDADRARARTEDQAAWDGADLAAGTDHEPLLDAYEGATRRPIFPGELP
jgi:hypothetical protein